MQEASGKIRSFSDTNCGDFKILMNWLQAVDGFAQDVSDYSVKCADSGTSDGFSFSQ